MKSLLDTAVLLIHSAKILLPKVRNSTSVPRKCSPCLLPFSMQRDFRRPREDNLAKKMAGFGNKSNVSDVATVDFFLKVR